jgi:hypothetical protein
MKWKILLLLSGVIVALIVVSCAPGIALPKYGVPMNIVEAGTVRDGLLENLADWVSRSSTPTVMLWYPSQALFSDRGIPNITGTDKYIFLNNEIVGSYMSSSDLEDAKDQISPRAKPTDNLSRNLRLRLEPKDLFGSVWDLVIGVGNEEKVITTPNAGYVLVQFIKENEVYRVTNAELKVNWNDLSVPKNIPANQLKGYAFFKIINGETVAALVIEP